MEQGIQTIGITPIQYTYYQTPTGSYYDVYSPLDSSSSTSVLSPASSWPSPPHHFQDPHPSHLIHAQQMPGTPMGVITVPPRYLQLGDSNNQSTPPSYMSPPLTTTPPLPLPMTPLPSPPPLPMSSPEHQLKLEQMESKLIEFLTTYKMSFIHWRMMSFMGYLSVFNFFQNIAPASKYASLPIDFSLNPFMTCQKMDKVTEPQFKGTTKVLEHLYLKENYILDDQYQRRVNEQTKIFQLMMHCRPQSNNEIESKYNQIRSTFHVIKSFQKTNTCDTLLKILKIYAKKQKNRRILTEAQDQSMNTWFKEHEKDECGPYPDDNEKSILGAMNNMSKSQLDNWFGNKRMRDKYRKNSSSGISSNSSNNNNNNSINNGRVVGYCLDNPDQWNNYHLNNNISRIEVPTYQCQVIKEEVIETPVDDIFMDEVETTDELMDVDEFDDDEEDMDEEDEDETDEEVGEFSSDDTDDE
ncbi:hypothetical protein SAMD00019534_072430 [Acytostelium subglobosum LB1]|uniref:hypothetical protein n=1 Tax=Acytostelium subglobosum LB1 TaxID=1410327 RepID=UPI0006449C3C|nr:hypothetical protein SAMD00019534_072430 [Acytostelium subglobosum LB1]GAM24068.1 hypothetical protein SAMD00019534_072430 [Acytostelium subglobosum LB1]|eukprot:XP_012753104.1 hypothetical protein SAMD00019534_072430 [Acytostelium subglobosum LB1]